MAPVLDVKNLPSPLLIVAPHPDDDILGCGGLIQVALRANKSIYVLFVTTGDGNTASVVDFLHKPLNPSSYIELGRLRHQEAIAAEQFLGVSSSNLFFLGFPDGIMVRIATDTNVFRVHRSPFTRYTEANYPFAYQRNAPYTHQSAVQLIESVLRFTSPGTIIVNLAQDIHLDHRAARMLTLEAVRNLEFRPEVYSYLIHYPNWPSTRSKLRPPAGIYLPGVYTLSLTLIQQENKLNAFQLHRSQFELPYDHTNLIRANELFWKREDGAKYELLLRRRAVVHEDLSPLSDWRRGPAFHRDELQLIPVKCRDVYESKSLVEFDCSAIE